MRRSHLAALAAVVALVAIARGARAQQSASRATADASRGDARRTPSAKLLASVDDAGATAMALDGATLTNVRVVNASEVLDAPGRTALAQKLSRNSADVARLRQAALASPSVRAALQAANVPADHVVGVAVSAGGVVVYHSAP